MRWNGTVSHRGHTTIAAMFAATKATQAYSSALRLSDAISRMAHRFDWRFRPELVAKPSDADIHHVRPRVEVVAPHGREDALPGHHLPRVLHQVQKQAKLAVREVGDASAHPGLPARQVEHDVACCQEIAVARRVCAELDADTREEFVKGEGLREVVVRAKLEAAQLGGQV